MPTIDERVAYLEGRVEEHTGGFTELTGRIDALDQKVDRRIDALDQKMDRGFEAVDLRFVALDQKISQQFFWIVGVQFAVLLAVIGALVDA